MKVLVVALALVVISPLAFSQKPSKPVAASTPKDNAYLGDNPATVTNAPTYHRHKRNKRRAASAASSVLPQN